MAKGGIAMGELKGIENLLAARDILRSSLERSKDIAFAIEKTGPRLEKSSQLLVSLRGAIQTVASNCALYEIRGHVDRAVGPAAAVLKVFNLVHELESLLSADPCLDLFGYLTTVKHLEEALQLLTSNCKLVILWLDDLVQFLEDKKYADDWYLLNVKKSLKIFRELHAMEEYSCLNGGVLMAAVHKLEKEFRRLLMENSFSTIVSSLPRLLEQSCIPPLSVPPPVIQKVQAIIVRLAAHDRLDKCICIYAEVRVSNVRTALQALDLDYLDLSLSEFDSVQTIEGYIDQWVKHLEIAVKHLLEMEYGLCKEVFQNAGYDDVWMDCFAKIAMQSGICDLLSFGNSVTKGKKEAIKLLKLLEIFEALNKVRLDFNRLFNGKACLEIQNQTRDLIKNVVNGVCEIFWELSVQVELQRISSPPTDGSVPKMVSFVIDFCNQLLEDDYMSVLSQILEIHRGWSHESFEKELIPVEVHNIIKALELNVDTWAKTYKDTTLSCLFLMNNHWYFCKNISKTKLGDLMGSFWLSEHEEYMEYYATIYLKESWEKLPTFLSEEGLILFPGGRAIDHNLVNKRLQAFTEAFEDMFKKQSNWILSDEGLRWRICQLIVQTIVPPYKSYMQKYIPFIEYEVDTSMYVKYTAANMENMITSLFQPKLGNYNSTKCTRLIDKVTSIVASHISSTPAAA